ncbi:hypothetical protein R3P38DRAFT_2770182 [Favolaschia claudopus]|uniref:Uncharacterized protein n=1 Tax=Favolaschia claudopus TaxID=2862362 RepID=A0AAW0CMK1_9AGAR
MPRNHKTYVFLQPLTPAHEVHNSSELPVITEESFMEPLTPEDFNNEEMGSNEAGDGVESQSEEEEPEAEVEKTPTAFDAAHGLGVDCMPSSHTFTGNKQLQQDVKSIDGAVCPNENDNHNDGHEDIAQATAALDHTELNSLFVVTEALDKISAEIHELRKEVVEIAKSIQFKIDCDSKKCD